MRRDIIGTIKFLGYIMFMIPYLIIGCMYRPLKWIVWKCSDFDKEYFYNR